MFGDSYSIGLDEEVSIMNKDGRGDTLYIYDPEGFAVKTFFFSFWDICLKWAHFLCKNAIAFVFVFLVLAYV